MCVCEREREKEREREIINDADDVAAAANGDATVVDARDAISNVDLDAIANDVALADDDALAADPIIDAAWGATPSKAHYKRSRSRGSNHFGKNLHEGIVL